MVRLSTNGWNYAKSFFKCDRDIYLCIVYYAPKSRVDIIETIERDITEKYGINGDILIAGDLNSRTGSQKDFIADDDTHHIPIQNNNDSTDYVEEERASQDSIIDSRVKTLLEFCISNQIRILNGRCCGDSLGSYTCY